jgi:hypothetical protein
MGRRGARSIVADAVAVDSIVVDGVSSGVGRSFENERTAGAGRRRIEKVKQTPVSEAIDA